MSFLYRSVWVSSSLHVIRLNEDCLRIIMYYNNIVYCLKHLFQARAIWKYNFVRHTFPSSFPRTYRAMLWMAERNTISYPCIIFVGTQTKELGAYLMIWWWWYNYRYYAWAQVVMVRKFFLCLNKHISLKAYGEWSYGSTLFQSLLYMISVSPRPLYPREKSSRCVLKRRFYEPQSRFWRFGEWIVQWFIMNLRSGTSRIGL